MKIHNLVKELNLTVYEEGASLDREITGGYASDLLSDVMGHANQDNVWVTLQNHLNIIAVASLKDLAGIVLVQGLEPAPEVLQRAREEGITLLGTPLHTFEICARIYLTLCQHEPGAR